MPVVADCARTFGSADRAGYWTSVNCVSKLGRLFIEKFPAPATSACRGWKNGPRLAPIMMPVYFECLKRALPVYTIANIDDSYGRIVAYERLLMPFSNGSSVTDIIALLKTISDDGNFEIRNLMRGNDTLPAPKLRAVIDRGLFHRLPGRIPAGDVIEFS